MSAREWNGEARLEVRRAARLLGEMPEPKQRTARARITAKRIKTDLNVFDRATGRDLTRFSLVSPYRYRVLEYRLAGSDWVRFP